MNYYIALINRGYKNYFKLKQDNLPENDTLALALYEKSGKDDGIPALGSEWIGDIKYENEKFNLIADRYCFQYNTYRDAVSKAREYIKRVDGKIIKVNKLNYFEIEFSTDKDIVNELLY